MIYGLCGLSVALSLFVTKQYLYKYIERQMFVPELISEKSSRGFFQPIKSLFGFGRYKGPKFRDLILADKEKNRLNEYFNVLKNAEKLKIELPSLMLYGPPGTGKTEAAKRIAKELGFNFAFLSGSAFSGYSEEKSIAKMSELFKWAETGTGQTIIFIDEAENLLRNRTSEQNSEKTLKLMTHFLSFTGSLNKNYTLIYATNRPDILDEAMNRRITYQIKLGLPGKKERCEIAEFYFNSYIKKHTHIKSKIDDMDSLLGIIAQKTEGLSGAYIEEIFMRARNQSAMNEYILDEGILIDAADEVIEKSKNKEGILSSGPGNIPPAAA